MPLVASFPALSFVLLASVQMHSFLLLDRVCDESSTRCRNQARPTCTRVSSAPSLSPAVDPLCLARAFPYPISPAMCASFPPTHFRPCPAAIRWLPFVERSLVCTSPPTRTTRRRMPSRNLTRARSRRRRPCSRWASGLADLRQRDRPISGSDRSRSPSDEVI